MVTTYEFTPVGTDSTMLKLTVHASGEVPGGIPAVVEGVWHHFLLKDSDLTS